MTNSIDRRTLIRRAAAGGAVAWVAPAIFHIDSAAAFVSCGGTTTSWSAEEAGTPLAGAQCDEGPGYSCGGSEPTTRTVQIDLDDIASHSQINISGVIRTNGWDNGGGAEDMFMIHVGTTRVYCDDAFNNGQPNETIDIDVAHEECTATVFLTACTTAPDETWGYTLTFTAS